MTHVKTLAIVTVCLAALTGTASAQFSFSIGLGSGHSCGTAITPAPVVVSPYGYAPIYGATSPWFGPADTPGYRAPVVYRPWGARRVFPSRTRGARLRRPVRNPNLRRPATLPRARRANVVPAGR